MQTRDLKVMCIGCDDRNLQLIIDPPNAPMVKCTDCEYNDTLKNFNKARVDRMRDKREASSPGITERMNTMLRDRDLNS